MCGKSETCRASEVVVAADLEFDTHGSRGGNPGLKALTASRYESAGGVTLVLEIGIGLGRAKLRWREGNING